MRKEDAQEVVEKDVSSNDVVDTSKEPKPRLGLYQGFELAIENFEEVVEIGIMKILDLNMTG